MLGEIIQWANVVRGILLAQYPDQGELWDWKEYLSDRCLLELHTALCGQLYPLIGECSVQPLVLEYTLNIPNLKNI